MTGTGSAVMTRAGDRDVRGVQTPLTVARAELRKLLAPGGVRVWSVVAVVLGTLAGLGTVVLTLVDDVQEILGLTVAESVSTGPLVATAVLGVAAAGHVPREVGDGTIVTSRYLVPRVTTLFVGRLLGWGVLTAVVAASSAVVTLLLAMVVPSVRPSGVGVTAAALLLAVVVPVATVVLVHAGAIVLRRGAYVVVVGVAVLLVVPLAAAIGQLTLTGAAAGAARTASAVMVGPLVLQAMSPPSAHGGSWPATLGSLVGLLAWLAAVVALASWSFRRPGYGE